MPGEAPVERDGVGIDEELRGVEPEPAVRIVGTVRAQTVAHAGADAGNCRGENPVRAALERDAVQFGLAVGVEQAEPKLRRRARPDGEARASGDRRRSERRRLRGPVRRSGDHVRTRRGRCGRGCRRAPRRLRSLSPAPRAVSSAVARGVGLEAFEIDAQGRAGGAGARQAEDRAAAAFEEDADALMRAGRAVHRVAIGEIVGGLDGQARDPRAGQVGSRARRSSISAVAAADSTPS